MESTHDVIEEKDPNIKNSEIKDVHKIKII
jgi:hypothetical protein